MVSYWVVLSLVRLFVPLAPCTQLGYSLLSTMDYWISTSVAVPYLFDSITCFVPSYILSLLYLCFKTYLFRYLGSIAFLYFGTGYLVVFYLYLKRLKPLKDWNSQASQERSL